MSAPYPPQALDAATDGRLSALSERCLLEMWNAAQRAGLDPETSGELCEVVILRLTEAVRSGKATAPEFDAAQWAVQIADTETQRAIQLASWHQRRTWTKE